jgi:7,8-dihydro-6-hydroxymethylpterin-pyrophosphokinase
VAANGDDTSMRSWPCHQLSPLGLLDQLSASSMPLAADTLINPTLDLDLLLYGNVMVDHLRLQVPHPRGATPLC